MEKEKRVVVRPRRPQHQDVVPPVPLYREKPKPVVSCLFQKTGPVLADPPVVMVVVDGPVVRRGVVRHRLVRPREQE